LAIISGRVAASTRNSSIKAKLGMDRVCTAALSSCWRDRASRHVLAPRLELDGELIAEELAHPGMLWNGG
jgi:hypothetical protein